MKKLLAFVLLFTLFSCNKTTVFTKNITDFKDNRWQKSDLKTFEFEIKKDVEAADIELDFSHVFDPQYQSVPLEVMVYGPEDKKSNIYLNLQIKDDSGNYISDCAGDVCDIKVDIKENIKLVKGKYKITVENRFENEYLPNVLALGLTVNSKE